MLPLAKIKGNKNRASSDARCVMCAAYDGEKKKFRCQCPISKRFHGNIHSR